MTENDLLLKIEGLEKVIKEQQDSADTYKLQLEETKKQLVDYNKPELTSAQLDDIHDAIENTVNDFDFEDTGNYNIEYELDYDGRVLLKHLGIIYKASPLFLYGNWAYPLTDAMIEQFDELHKKVKQW